MKPNTNRLGARLSSRTPRIRILRSWRGFPVGAIIQPPAGARQILLQAKDQLGNKVAEEVKHEVVAGIALPPPGGEATVATAGATMTEADVLGEDAKKKAAPQAKKTAKPK
jgi:hypothetical protein